MDELFVCLQSDVQCDAIAIATAMPRVAGGWTYRDPKMLRYLTDYRNVQQ